jgi:hypothetical protein
MNEETAYQEFIQLLYNDPDFEDQWGYNDKEQQKNAFFEWCSLYEDLDHIKEKKKGG